MTSNDPVKTIHQHLILSTSWLTCGPISLTGKLVTQLVAQWEKHSISGLDIKNPFEFWSFYEVLYFWALLGNQWKRPVKSPWNIELQTCSFQVEKLHSRQGHCHRMCWRKGRVGSRLWRISSWMRSVQFYTFTNSHSIQSYILKWVKLFTFCRYQAIKCAFPLWVLEHDECWQGER